jgi:Domain of unknown function (DUF4437)
MSRPHLERQPDRRAPWKPLPVAGFGAGARSQVLSVDPRTGGASLRLRVAGGYRRAGGYLSADIELFVLTGRLQVGVDLHGPGSYLYVPAGVVLPAISTARGAEWLAFWSEGPPEFMAGDSDHPSAERDRLVVAQGYDGRGWVRPSGHPLRAPGYLVKPLRRDPLSGAVTFLEALAPEFREDAVVYHDCALETYQLRGSQLNLCAGEAPAGSYACRPPFVNHGPTVSGGGSLALVRTDGELVNHFHTDPGSSPAEHRARAVDTFRQRRPTLAAAMTAAGGPRRVRRS